MVLAKLFHFMALFLAIVLAKLLFWLFTLQKDCIHA